MQRLLPVGSGEAMGSPPDLRDAGAPRGDADDLAGAAGAIGVALPPSAVTRLLAYEELLRARGSGLGVVAAGDLPGLRERHLLDCLRAAPLVPEGSDAFDLGSGGGLPGVVIACAVPSARVALVESRRLRASFLELVIERLGLENAWVAPTRIQELDGRADVCLARALAPPGRAWELAAPLLGAEGRLVYFAGRGAAATPRPSAMSWEEIPPPPALASSGPLVIMSRP
jgi:16S rRNA (guanine527-N7)-methyltransferase